MVISKKIVQIIKINHLIWLWIILFPFRDLAGQIAINEESTVRSQLWFYLFSHFYVNPNLEYYGDSGYRTVLNENIFNKIYIRPSVRYHFSEYWEVHGGIGFFYSNYKENINRFEIRPWQGVKINWPKFEKLRFNHLIRFEERFSYWTDDWKSSFEFRLRYKLAARIDILKTGTDSFWFIPAYGEIFLPVSGELDELFRNQSRAGIGLGYNESKEWRFEILFNWQTFRSEPDEGLLVTDYLYQIKIRRLWNFKRILNY